jgi:hypothetical protein
MMFRAAVDCGSPSVALFYGETGYQAVTFLAKLRLSVHFWMRLYITVQSAARCSPVACNMYRQCSDILQGDCSAWFQAAAATLMIFAPFRDITQRRVVIPYRRFGTTFRSHFPGWRNILTLNDGSDKLYRNVSRELLLPYRRLPSSNLKESLDPWRWER